MTDLPRFAAACSILAALTGAPYTVAAQPQAPDPFAVDRVFAPAAAVPAARMASSPASAVRGTKATASAARTASVAPSVALAPAAIAQRPVPASAARPFASSPATVVAPAPTPVASASAKAQAAEHRILVQTSAERETTLSSPVTGRILRIHGPIGAHFGAGEVLVAFDCNEPQARARMAEAELTAAQDTLEAKIRLKALDSASDVEVAAAAAAASRAEAQLRLARYQVSQCVIAAPFSGHVVRVVGKAAQTVTPGQPLLEIVSAGKPKLRMKAQSRLMPQLPVGRRLEVNIEETGKHYVAVVTSVNARVDPVNQTIELEARFVDAAADLRPGMSGTALLLEGEATPAKRR